MFAAAYKFMRRPAGRRWIPSSWPTASPRMGQDVLPVIGNLDGFYRSFTRKPVAVPDKEGQPIATKFECVIHAINLPTIKVLVSPAYPTFLSGGMRCSHRGAHESGEDWWNVHSTLAERE